MSDTNFSKARAQLTSVQDNSLEHSAGGKQTLDHWPWKPFPFFALTWWLVFASQKMC